MGNELVKTGSGQLALAGLPLNAVAIGVLHQTSNAGFAAEEFFKGSIANEHTRRAYGRIVGRFLSWCDGRGVALHQITPGLAGECMQKLEGSPPTKNQALAALRHFFDALVQRHAVPLNSFASVRGQKHSVMEGKTPEISVEQARKLLRSIERAMSLGCAIGPCLESLLIPAHASARWLSSTFLTTGTWASSASSGSVKKAAKNVRYP